MNVRIQFDSGGVDSGSDIAAVVDADAAVGMEFLACSCGFEVEAGNALRRISVAEDRIEQAHIQLALHLALPAGMGKVIERASDFKSMTLRRRGPGGDPQRTYVDCCAGEVGRGLKIAVHGRMRVSLAAPRDIQVHGAGFDVVTLQPGRLWDPYSGGNVVHQQGKVAGIEFQRDITILEVEA